MRKYLLPAICYMLTIGAANAVCPVCTVAIGAGLEGARLLGVDDVITGLWAGAMTLTMIFWTAKWMAKHKIQNGVWYLMDFVVWYAFLAALYLTPALTYRANLLWGVDKFMLGTIVGSVAFYIAERFNARLIRNNNGRSLFKFQKVIVPVVILLALSGVFSVIVK